MSDTFAHSVHDQTVRQYRLELTTARPGVARSKLISLLRPNEDGGRRTRLARDPLVPRDPDPALPLSSRKQMAGKGDEWADLATRHLKTTLKRHDVGYEELAPN